MIGLSLALLTALSALQGPMQGPSALVRGQVRSEGSGTPLRFAVVQIVTSGVARVATTDSAGFYVLRNVPSGRRLLRATHFDHAPLEVEVVVHDYSELVLDFALELRPVRLPPLTARAVTLPSSHSDTLPAGAVALGQANVKVLEATPGVAELGLSEVIRDVPGPEPPDPSDVLYVRGGTADLKLVLLNGAPVYAPFHLGGLINPLDNDLMRTARLYVGGAPARYDGGLSYVMDLETRSGRSKLARASVGFDMLSSRTVLEGPITNWATYLLGARAVHGMGARAFVADPFPYSYADGVGRLDINIGIGHVSATGFWNQESVRLDSLAGANNGSATWGNIAGSLRFRAQVLGADAEFTASVGRFHTQLPVGGVRPIITDGAAVRERLVAHFARAVGDVNLQYGASLDRQHYEYRAWPRSATPDSMLLRSDAVGDVTGFYVDGSWQAHPRLTLRGGARTDVFSVSPAPRVAPRVSATLLLTDRASLTVAAGRYRQYVRAQGGAGFIGTPLPDTVRRSPLAVARASHLVVALDQDLGDGIRLGLEGYYKTFEGLPSASGEAAEASGADLWVRRGIGRYTGWLGYSLAWLWSVQTNSTRAANFVGRQLLSAGASGPLGAAGRFDVRVAYGAGLPFTAIPEPEATPPVFSVVNKPDGNPDRIGEDFPTYPLPPDEQYLRVDAQVARTFITDVRGFAFELTPYFKLLNALDRRDALFYHFDRTQQDPQAKAIAALPVLPIVGLEWRF